MIKKIFKVNGMHCASCATMIESDLEDMGVKASCSYATQKLDVEFDEQKIAEGKIKSVVTEAGYSLE